MLAVSSLLVTIGNLPVRSKRFKLRLVYYSSLVTTLRAAEKFEQSHLSSPAVAAAIDSAKVIYLGGFFLTHGTSSIVELGTKASAAGKVCFDPFRYMSCLSCPRPLFSISLRLSSLKFSVLIYNRFFPTVTLSLAMSPKQRHGLPQMDFQIARISPQ